MLNKISVQKKISKQNKLKNESIVVVIVGLNTSYNQLWVNKRMHTTWIYSIYICTKVCINIYIFIVCKSRIYNTNNVFEFFFYFCLSLDFIIYFMYEEYIHCIWCCCYYYHVLLNIFFYFIFCCVLTLQIKKSKYRIFFLLYVVSTTTTATAKLKNKKKK